jgi:hypothetical protein
MGLDVYLYEYEDHDDTIRLEAEYNRKSEEVWECDGRTYEKMSEEEKNQARETMKEFATSIGLAEGGSDTARSRKIEMDWPGAPEHLFKIGYFRSSYNEGGINSVFRRRGLPTLTQICGKPEGCDDDFRPDWAEMKAKALAVRQKYVAEITQFPYDVFCIDPTFSTPGQPDSEAEALSRFREEMSRHCGFECYSSRMGQFWRKDQPVVHAIIPGQKYGRPCHYVIQKNEAATAEGSLWYATALDIVAATADYVLSQPDPTKFWLSWSG